MTRDELEAALRRFFERNRSDVVAAWLFGSRARGQSRPSSDVDIAVLFDKAPPRTLAGLPSDLADGIAADLGPGAPGIDLVVLNRASCDLVHRVLRDGTLLVERDPAARARFEVRARNEYFDLKPFLDRYRRREKHP